MIRRVNVIDAKFEEVRPTAARCGQVTILTRDFSFGQLVGIVVLTTAISGAAVGKCLAFLFF